MGYNILHNVLWCTLHNYANEGHSSIICTQKIHCVPFPTYGSQRHASVSLSSVDTDTGILNNIIFQGCVHEVNMLQCAAFVAMVISLMRVCLCFICICLKGRSQYIISATHQKRNVSPLAWKWTKLFNPLNVLGSCCLCTTNSRRVEHSKLKQAVFIHTFIFTDAKNPLRLIQHMGLLKSQILKNVKYFEYAHKHMVHQEYFTDVVPTSQLVLTVL